MKVAKWSQNIWGMSAKQTAFRTSPVITVYHS